MLFKECSFNPHVLQLITVVEDFMTCFADLSVGNVPTFISFESTCIEGELCTTIASSTFASCPADSSMFVESCVTDICNGKMLCYYIVHCVTS